MTAAPTSTTPLRSAAAPIGDGHEAQAPEPRWYHAPVTFAAFLGSIALGYLTSTVVLLVLFGAGDSEGLLLHDPWAEACLLLGLGVALSAPKVVVRFVERRAVVAAAEAGTESPDGRGDDAAPTRRRGWYYKPSSIWELAVNLVMAAIP